MKRFLILFVLLAPVLLSVKSLDVTRTWVYQNPSVVANLAPYDAALAASDLDRYRYFDQHSILNFENGLKVELLSANEVIAMGLPVKTERVRTQAPAFDTGSIFHIAQNGHLVEVMTKTKIK